MGHRGQVSGEAGKCVAKRQQQVQCNKCVQMDTNVIDSHGKTPILVRAARSRSNHLLVSSNVRHQQQRRPSDRHGRYLRMLTSCNKMRSKVSHLLKLIILASLAALLQISVPIANCQLEQQYSQFNNHPNNQLLAAFLEQQRHQIFQQQQQQQQPLPTIASLLPPAAFSLQMMPPNPFRSLEVQQPQQQQPDQVHLQATRRLPNMQQQVRPMSHLIQAGQTAKTSRMDEAVESKLLPDRAKPPLVAGIRPLSAPYEPPSFNGSAILSLKGGELLRSKLQAGDASQLGDTNESAERQFDASEQRLAAIDADSGEPIQDEQLQYLEAAPDEPGDENFGSRRQPPSDQNEPANGQMQAEDELQQQHQQQQMLDTDQQQQMQSEQMLLDAQEEQQQVGPNESTGDEAEQQMPDEGAVHRGDQSEEQGSFLTVQLPSQYEAVTTYRLPPEGYYDDYFKLAPAPHESLLGDRELPSKASSASKSNSDFDTSNPTGELQATIGGLQRQEAATDLDPLQGVKLSSPSGQNATLVSTDDISSQFEGPLGEDGAKIKLIAANSNGTRDPVSQEKQISYTLNDSQNGTRTISDFGSSNLGPRETFFNRDMNEFPGQQNELGNLQSTEAPQAMLSATSKTQRQNQQVADQMAASEDASRDDDVGHEGHKPVESELRRIQEEDPDLAGSFGQYKDGVRMLRSHKGAKNGPPRQENQRRSTQAGRAGQQQQHSNLKQQQKRRQQQNSLKQQVTQVDLDAKQLPMKAPRLPDGEQATRANVLQSLASIPTKVKQIREHQPDKNEMMNELLTALDRVKVAIYKLQPLTAKMNAMYRKSVTSNTRDMLMDNNKGTYATRYPPGDYDDSYSRLRPADLVASGGGGSLLRRSGAMGQQMQASASEIQPVYVRMPQSMNGTATPSGLTSDQLEPSETQLVATGVGRRLGNGQVQGRLNISQEEAHQEPDDQGELSLPFWRRVDADGSGRLSFELGPSYSDDYNNPAGLFGYRITIVQAPESEQGELTAASSEDKPEDDSEPMATSESSVVPSNGGKPRARSSLADLEAQPAEDAARTKFDDENTDSAVDKRAEGDTDTTSDDDDDSGDSDGDGDKATAESGKKSVKHKKKKKDAEKKKEKKLKEAEKKSHESKGKKSMHKKMAAEESKKRKEYKKIKHQKGVLSKEKKTMKRDKHIKAHDRGAAKEKALKERTQIEFFEREQILDDEYDKSKKSTKKAQWQVGQESHKSTADSLGKVHSAGGDLSARASDPVEHQTSGSRHQLELPMDAQASEFHGQKEAIGDAKGHEKKSELASSKESNKFEKKSMHASGKKVKGWREKGYKIITETEFIDRGSLHDSAYKKRDKGAAHHQKFKKHEASSEGHEGSMQELTKKTKKKEEKKSKHQEKKSKEGKKEQKSHSAKKHKKQAETEKEKEKKGQHSAPKPAHRDPPAAAASSLEPRAAERRESTVKPLDGKLSRLVEASSQRQELQRRASDGSKKPQQARGPLNATVAPTTTTTERPSTNSTIVDIVDASTGRQLNKTRIGTYEMANAEQTGHGHRRRATRLPASDAIKHQQHQQQQQQPLRNSTLLRNQQPQQHSSQKQPDYRSSNQARLAQQVAGQTDYEQQQRPIRQTTTGDKQQAMFVNQASKGPDRVQTARIGKQHQHVQMDTAEQRSLKANQLLGRLLQLAAINEAQQMAATGGHSGDELAEMQPQDNLEAVELPYTLEAGELQQILAGQQAGYFGRRRR